MSAFARRIRPYVELELDAAGHARARGDLAAGLRHLERAHVLGQASTALHVRVHWRMLLWAMDLRHAGHAAGQLMRLVAALLLTGIGWLPLGNTGGSNVSAIRPMPIPPDLQRLLDAARQ
jgi:hypothetical protein